MNWQTITNRVLKGKKARFLEICKNNGVKLDFALNSNALDVFFSIFYEREYADHFPFYRKVNIIDIGAHYGYFSIFSAINIAKGSKIIAVEPDPANFKKLVQNTNANGLIDIECINCAIAGKSGQSAFFTGNGVNSSLLADYLLNKPDQHSDTIETKTLGQIFQENNLSRVDFLKMDCEGSEYQILLETSPEVFNKVTTISMEFHDMRDARYTVETIINILTQNGFKIVKYKYDKSTIGLNYGKIIGTKILN